MASFDYTNFTQEMWSMLIQAEREKLPDLRPIILKAGSVEGYGIVTFPYVSLGAAAHVADGTALTGSYDAGTPQQIQITVDKHPTKPVLLGKLGAATASPEATQKIVVACATSLADYESELIMTTINAMTGDHTVTADADAAGLTLRDDIGDLFAGAIGQAYGKLSAAKIPAGMRSILVDPVLAGFYFTTEKFASSDYSRLGNIAGLTGSYMGMPIVAHPSVPLAYSGQDDVTTGKIYVMYEEACGIAWAQDMSLIIERNPNYNCNQAVADAIIGVSAGRTACLAEINVTITGNPMGL